MNVLVIYTYPHRKSLNGAFLQKVIDGCGENDQVREAKVIDLYKENFNPALIFNETKRRRDMHIDPNLASYRELITWADKLVFVYPIWWGRPPAMLLGFIDQMFASNFAYRDRPGLFPEGLLAGKSAVCVSTMKGPAHYPRFWLNNAHQVLMKRALFSFVGIKRVTFFEFGNMEKKNGDQEKKLDRVYRYFKRMKR
ncbi:NAD(P)H-dependent oxidoreductase [Domibacillus sp. DTU_2020_1001157_1_SI_ALB_TIR_016]|uniref:NAD(P)H-dependent oxidoreductase n=1 Tax=Domibacillus sp. DTU_2020_1001157_1_SI_ALB_TIR_016 TaxID=3077789 RepID=UPI0028EB5C35|nr:NAD(P)H-dependent oxidoreductase [Domibacillus sp. DTU_2020_1001157_1_SI_ALB_TIR_016]WNS80013.1 NAD(P)H-dependent oxidoreductase [Domibacillus sp. DTU_2020_1001157_1_SI_ALB_TIR_016]